MITSARNRQRPLAVLIQDRCRELGVSRTGLLRRTRSRNLAKTLRRLDALCAGERHRAAALIRGLPDALDVPPSVVEQAIDETQRQLERVQQEHAAAEDARWRAAFTPHAIILTECTVPSPIFVEALGNYSRFRYIAVDATAEPASFLSQALTALWRVLRERDWEAIPAWGRPTGLVVNYTPEYAARYDLDGHVLQTLPSAYRLGRAHLCLANGRRLPPSLFRAGVAKP